MSVVVVSPCPAWKYEVTRTFYFFETVQSMPSSCIERLMLSCGSLV
jgi:hypothetical protein